MVMLSVYIGHKDFAIAMDHKTHPFKLAWDENFIADLFTTYFIVNNHNCIHSIIHIKQTLLSAVVSVD